MRIDYHIHTGASFDCVENADAVCRTAIKRGLTAIALTDHMDFLPNHEINWQTDFDAAYHEIALATDKYSGVLDVARGVEFGQPEYNRAEAARFVELYHPDFIIGSIHYLDPSFDIGMSSLAEQDPVELFLFYLGMLRKLAVESDYDVLGHLTYPWRYFKRERDYDFTTADYLDRFEELFMIVIERGKGIEVNTSGLRQPLGECLPNEEIVRLYRACGGTIITTGSDAHRLDQIGLGIDEATEMIRRIGFEGITTYHKRIPTMHPF
ncbi:MAG: histidinol-phosphatase HisJ family protein [Coriobacteriia bacterium]|nr:histidinol-phosphatase HisJ family protein [Coriobacteriia bacterium]